MEKGESASGINGNVGVVGCMIVEDVPIHARIVVTWARVKIVVQGKSVSIMIIPMYNILTCIPYVPFFFF